jgi:hypothetical protein
MAKAKVEEVAFPVDAVQPNVEAGVRSRLSGSPAHDSQLLATMRPGRCVQSSPITAEYRRLNWAAESLQRAG